MPEFSKSRSSSFARSSAARGSAAGPALKFIARLMCAHSSIIFGYARGVRTRVLLLGFGLLACNGKATKEQCSEMLDKYLDMTIAGEPGLSDLTPSEQRAAREMKKALRKNEPSYARV